MREGRVRRAEDAREGLGGQECKPVLRIGGGEGEAALAIDLSARPMILLRQRGDGAPDGYRLRWRTKPSRATADRVVPSPSAPVSKSAKLKAFTQAIY
jgi:hypothetical protein